MSVIMPSHIKMTPNIYRQFRKTLSKVTDRIYSDVEIEKYVIACSSGDPAFSPYFWYEATGSTDGIEIQSGENVCVQVYKGIEPDPNDDSMWRLMWRLMEFHKYDVFPCTQWSTRRLEPLEDHRSGRPIENDGGQGGQGGQDGQDVKLERLLSCGDVGDVYVGTTFTFHYKGKIATVEDQYGIMTSPTARSRYYFKETDDGAEYHWFGADPINCLPTGYIKVVFMLTEDEKRRNRRIKWLIRDRIISKLYDPRTAAGQRRANISYESCCLKS
jgi:hypothetical protein